MDEPVIIFGAGTLGKTAMDIFNENNILIYGFLDDKKELHNQEIGSVVVLGSTDDDGFLKIIGNKTESFVAVRNAKDRKRLAAMIQTRRKTMPLNAIHRTAFVSEDAEIGHGNLISPNAVVGAFSKVGSFNIIGSGSIVDAGAEVADYIEIGPGTVINSHVKIEEEAFIGSNVTLISGITIGKGARIGAGSVVISDVKANQTVFGNPAQVVDK
jgi:sugar O-acyltransferase (sialic acid O-acetyltransferase NeuD family)